MKQRPHVAIVVNCFLILIGAVAVPVLAGKPSTVELAVSVDPRVELVSIVFYLSGGADYNQPAQYRPYRDRVDGWFSRFKDLPAVRYAVKLRADHGVGFDAPMDLAVRVSPDPSMKLLVPLEPWPGDFDRRWTPRTVRAFLSRLRRFRRDTDFDAFYRKNLPFYEEITARLRSAVRRELHLEWFPWFFGSGGFRKDELHIVAGALLGPCNYGPSVEIAGHRQRYAIIGVSRTDAAGKPAFDREDMSIVVHEFCHTFANPVVRRWMEQLRPLFAQLLSRHRQEFGAQAYTDPESIAYETMVRACVERYLLDTAGEAAAGEYEKEQQRRTFLWVGDLCRLLGTYEEDRVTYSDLESFMPRVVSFLREWVAAHRAPGRPGRDPTDGDPRYVPAFATSAGNRSRACAVSFFRQSVEISPRRRGFATITPSPSVAAAAGSARTRTRAGGRDLPHFTIDWGAQRSSVRPVGVTGEEVTGGVAHGSVPVVDEGPRVPGCASASSSTPASETNSPLTVTIVDVDERPCSSQVEPAGAHLEHGEIGRAPRWTFPGRRQRIRCLRPW